MDKGSFMATIYDRNKVKARGLEALKGVRSEKTAIRGADRQMLDDLLSGKERFAPDVERCIAKEEAELKTSRGAIIEQAIVMAMEASQRPAGKRGKKRR